MRIAEHEPAKAREQRPRAGFVHRAAVAGAGLLIVAACIAAYSDSFEGPFVYDDTTAIARNVSIRNLADLGAVLRPPTDTTVEGRPVLNLTFALNYAAGGQAVRGYHLTNLAIHILAALTLMGLVRRSLLAPAMARLSPAALPLAAAVAMLWSLHPLATQALTYTVQRAESLATLFYMLTLYFAARGLASPRGRAWYALSVAACALGMGAKEIMFSAPLAVLLYDRALWAGSFAAALRRRPWLYAALAATWLALASVIGDRHGTAGAIEGITPMDYALTQGGVILHYLRLAFWPNPLVFDYDWLVARTAAEILPGVLVVGALLAATAWGLVRNRPWAIVGALFFLLLAPTSSFVPLRNIAFEHRMYGALACVVTIVVLGTYRLSLATGAGERRTPHRAMAAAMILLCLAAACACGAATFARNKDYSTALGLWQDTLAKRPTNAVAAGGAAAEYIELAGAGRNRAAMKSCVDSAMRLCDHAIDVLKSRGKLNFFERRTLANVYATRSMAHSLPASRPERGADTAPYWKAAADDAAQAIALDGGCKEAYCNIINAYGALGSLAKSRGQTGPAAEWFGQAWRYMNVYRHVAVPDEGLVNQLIRESGYTGWQ